MRPRYPKWLFILIISLTVIGITSIIASLFFSADRLLLMGSGTIMISVLTFCTGLFQLKVSKAIDTPTPWWKLPQISMALFFFLLGCLYLLMAFHVSEIVENVFIIPYVIVLGALSIYSLWFAILFAKNADKKRQAQLKNR
jgi:hypothetical protein